MDIFMNILLGQIKLDKQTKEKWMERRILLAIDPIKNLSHSRLWRPLLLYCKLFYFKKCSLLLQTITRKKLILKQISLFMKKHSPGKNIPHYKYVLLQIILKSYSQRNSRQLDKAKALEIKL